MENSVLSLISSDYSQYRIIGNNIYILANNYNGLFRTSISGGQVEMVRKFVHQYNYAIKPFHLIKWDEKLFFLPARADEIAIYDSQNDELFEMPLEWGSSGKWIAHEHVFADGHLWIFPMEDGRIVKIDYERKQIRSVIDLREIYVQRTGADYHFFSATGCYCYGDEVFLACYELPYVVKFNVKTQEIDFVHVDETKEGFTGLTGREGYLYIICTDGRLMIWDIENESVTRFINIGEKVSDFEPREYVYMNVVGRNLFVCDNNDIAKMLNISIVEDYEISMWDNTVINELEQMGFSKKLQLKYYEGYDLYGCDEKDQFFCIDLLANKLKFSGQILYDPCLLKENIRDVSVLLHKKQKVIPENVVAFEDYIEGNFERTMSEESSYVGKRIHQNIIEEL